MKLYYSPGACSLCCDIALNESGLGFDREKVDLKTKKTENDKDFTKINPKGYVPALELDNGEILSENGAILLYIADKAPTKQLAPAPQSEERHRLQEWLFYISTELHKSFGPFFNQEMPDKARDLAKDKLEKRFGLIENQLAKSEYLMGDQFSVADCYLFTMLRWLAKTPIKIEQWPAISKYFDKVKARPAVSATLDSEGLK